MNRKKNAFTLIEISIVLVIIGLIIGGILTGKSLIASATIRAQITQLEKYNTAANTFFDKYGALPGDIPQALVTKFAFATLPIRPGGAGQGDGNGVLEGFDYANSNVYDTIEQGETSWFWEDLSANSGLIPEYFNTAGAAQYHGGGFTTGAQIDQYMPQAKIGNGNYVGLYSYNGFNYFVISAINKLGPGGGWYPNTAMSVAQAYGIDSKVDDGLPQSGKVTAQYVGVTSLTSPIWAGATGTAATTGSATTCYDNGSVAGTQKYSLAQGNGENQNCSISVRLQIGE